MHVTDNVRQRIEAGHRDFVNEIRVCTVIFVGLPSLQVRQLPRTRSLGLCAGPNTLDMHLILRLSQMGSKCSQNSPVGFALRRRHCAIDEEARLAKHRT